MSFQQSYQAHAWFLPSHWKSQELTEFRCIASLLEGRDVLGLFPTGFGKSLIYQPYPKVFELLKGKAGHACHILVGNNYSIEQVQELNEISCALTTTMLKNHCFYKLNRLTTSLSLKDGRQCQAPFCFTPQHSLWHLEKQSKRKAEFLKSAISAVVQRILWINQLSTLHWNFLPLI